LSAHEVQVGDKVWSSERLLIATGSWPYIPDFPGAELCITSNEIFDLPEFPKRFLVYGGGYIAVEFASIFNGLGAETTLVYRGDKLLRGFDEEVRDFAQDEIKGHGISLLLGREILRIDRHLNAL